MGLYNRLPDMLFGFRLGIAVASSPPTPWSRGHGELHTRHDERGIVPWHYRCKGSRDSEGIGLFLPETGPVGTVAWLYRFQRVNNTDL